MLDKSAGKIQPKSTPSNAGTEHLAKGVLIQSKKSGQLSAGERDRLRAQCEKMDSRSHKGSFVWIYTSSGVQVIPASEVLANPNVDPGEFGSRNIAEQFRDVLDCFAGDRNLVMQGIFDSAEALSRWLRELAVQRGVAIRLTQE